MSSSFIQKDVTATGLLQDQNLLLRPLREKVQRGERLTEQEQQNLQTISQEIQRLRALLSPDTNEHLDALDVLRDFELKESRGEALRPDEVDTKNRMLQIVRSRQTFTVSRGGSPSETFVGDSGAVSETFVGDSGARSRSTFRSNSRLNPVSEVRSNYTYRMSPSQFQSNPVRAIYDNKMGL